MREFSILELVEKGDIAPTGAKPKLPIKLDGLHSETLSVYKIPLDYLYYNDENGRIRTSLSSLAHTLTAARQQDDGDVYNQEIEALIVNSNASKLNTTKKDIQTKGQLIFGYVLDDGRVVDGNRRFTALRQIARETETFQYFEAVVLPITYEQRASKQVVKSLELALQHGIESKVDYDPADTAVDVYQTVEVDGLMGIGDYAKRANITQKEAQARINTVLLMRDFLISINAQDNYYQIIKDLNLYNPLYELAKVLQKQFPNGGVKAQEAKEAAFAYFHYLVRTPGGDLVRLTRDYIKTILTSPISDAYLEDIMETVEDIQDYFDESPISSSGDYRRKLEEMNPKIREIKKVTTDTINQQNSSKDVETFVDTFRKMAGQLQEVYRLDGLSGSLRWSQFSEQDIQLLRQYMADITVTSRELIDLYDEELND